MIERSFEKAVLTAITRTMPTVSVFSIGFSLCLGWGLLSGCADSTIVNPFYDLSAKGDGGGDGGTTPSSRFTAAPTKVNTLIAAPVDKFNDWKRDPNLVIDGNTQYLFFAGSPSTANMERWSIVTYTTTDTANPPMTWTVPSAATFGGRTGQWDSLDVTAPMVLVDSSTSPKFRMWYAGNGDKTKTMPDYVTQIGMATSTDGMNWSRTGGAKNGLALELSGFNGITSSSTPTSGGADAYGATDPAVIIDNGKTVLYYAGLDCSGSPCKYQILRSVSSDNGQSFPRGDVVWSGRGTAEETGGVAGPSVVVRNGVYVLAYTAVTSPATRDLAGVRKALSEGAVGIATSTDGVHFTYAGVSPVGIVQKASCPSNLCLLGVSGPGLYTVGTSLRLYFGGVTTGPLYSILAANVSETQ